MEIYVKDDEKLVDVWLTNAEKNDPVIRERLNDIYRTYKEKKYLVVVFESGGRDLYKSTLNLLAYNKHRCAEMEVEKEKKIRTVAMER